MANEVNNRIEVQGEGKEKILQILEKDGCFRGNSFIKGEKYDYEDGIYFYDEEEKISVSLVARGDAPFDFVKKLSNKYNCEVSLFYLDPAEPCSGVFICDNGKIIKEIEKKSIFTEYSFYVLPDTLIWFVLNDEEEQLLECNKEEKEAIINNKYTNRYVLELFKDDIRLKDRVLSHPNYKQVPIDVAAIKKFKNERTKWKFYTKCKKPFLVEYGKKICKIISYHFLLPSQYLSYEDTFKLILESGYAEGDIREDILMLSKDTYVKADKILQQIAKENQQTEGGK